MFVWNCRSRSHADVQLKFDLEVLERRVLLSTSIPLNTSSWTAMGPAPLDWGASSFGRSSGRMLDIATHPTDPNTWYVATAGGGVWKTTNAGTAWAPLTDTQPINFMGSVALAASNPSIIYAGSGEATWGPSKTVLLRDNIYYGRGVLKSIDAGATWTLTGQTEFFRRAIGKIVVDPSNPNIVYAAVGAVAQNGLPGNTGIWKTIDGGNNWTNTTTSISTTAAFSDLVMDPTNPLVLYAGVGDPDGDATNGLYKTTNGGTSWSPVATFPNQNDARLGRITLAMAPSSPLVVYGWVAASGQGGTSVGNDFQLVRTPDGGATWSARALPGTGVSLDYNMALGVDPANADTVYVAGKGSGGPSSSSVKKSVNGGTSWSSIGIGATQSPHADNHALVFASDGKLLDGNDGGIWRLENPTVGQIEWSSRNTSLGTAQFVGIALHPTNADIAYGGLQDNGTVKFQDNLLWPVIRGGDGGVARVDANTPNTVYHSFQWPGFIERSDNGGSTWNPGTNGINSSDPAYFYPPYVIDAAQTTRLLAGTNRVYETTNRAMNWAPISTPNANGWVGSSAIYAVAAAKTDVNVIYASTDGMTTALFATTNRGATWALRSPPITTRISDITDDPTDAMTAYAVVGRFDSSGHVWRTTNGGVSWSNISGNLPDLPVYSVELDVRGPGSADDVIWVGGDDGVYGSSDLGASWAQFATGLPNVQAKDLEYNKNLGILAVGTHGRGMWQIRVPDLTPPSVVQSSFTLATAPHRVSFRFSENVSPSLALSDITVENLTTMTTIPSASMNLAYDARTDTAALTFPGFTDGAAGVLPDGRYRMTVNAAGVTDGAGNALAANFVFDFFFLRGDANHDARVNLVDFNILAANFGQSPRDFTQGDFDYSNNVNLDDFNILASRFGTTVAPSVSLFGKSSFATESRGRIIDELEEAHV